MRCCCDIFFKWEQLWKQKGPKAGIILMSLRYRSYQHMNTVSRNSDMKAVSFEIRGEKYVIRNWMKITLLCSSKKFNKILGSHLYGK